MPPHLAYNYCGGCDNAGTLDDGADCPECGGSGWVEEPLPQLAEDEFDE